MKNTWRSDLLFGLFYSNFFIALCAFSCLQVTRWALSINSLPYGYDVGLFFGTMALYGAHRLIGLSRLEEVPKEGRFGLLFSYRQHLLVLTLIMSLLCLFSFLSIWRLDMILWSLPAGILGLLYITPLFGGNRLRDLGYVKVFVIALVWAWITAGLPLQLAHAPTSVTWLFFLERTAFLVALTLPFDIRDMHIDKLDGTKTIPLALGLNTSKFVALVFLFVSSYLAYVLNGSWIHEGVIWLHWSINLLLGVLIVKSSPQRSDLYYTGLMDGIFILHALALWAMNQALILE